MIKILFNACLGILIEIAYSLFILFFAFLICLIFKI